MKRKAYSRGERREMILNAFYSMIGDGLDPSMTAYQVARAIGLNSAQHVRNIMDGMVEDGDLQFVVVEHRPGVNKKVYCPKMVIELYETHPRLIPTFKVNGKVVK